jgi:hypothetical protein
MKHKLLVLIHIRSNELINIYIFFFEKISILPLVISATGIVPQSLFKNLKILDLDNTLVVEIQKGILLPHVTS